MAFRKSGRAPITSVLDKEAAEKTCSICGTKGSCPHTEVTRNIRPSEPPAEPK